MHYTLLSSRLKIQITLKSKNYSSVYSDLTELRDWQVVSAHIHYHHFVETLVDSWACQYAFTIFMLLVSFSALVGTTLPPFLANVLCIQLVPNAGSTLWPQWLAQKGPHGLVRANEKQWNVYWELQKGTLSSVGRCEGCCCHTNRTTNLTMPSSGSSNR